MKTKVVITSWNDKPIPKNYSKEEYGKYVKVGWEVLLSTLLSMDNPNNDEFEIESVEVTDDN